MIAAIVLAAGRSSRFGAQKLVAPVAGKPLLRWTVERVLSSGVDRTFVVVPADGVAAFRHVLSGLATEIVVNEVPQDGMGGSLRLGVRALPPGTRAVIIALGDQPAIARGTVDRLIARYRETGAPIVAPAYDGVRGHPVLFDASLFGELAAIHGDRGARDVVARWAGSVGLVEIEGPAPSDIDVPDDVVRVEGELNRELRGEEPTSRV